MAEPIERTTGDGPPPGGDPPGRDPYVWWAWGPGRPYYFRPGLQEPGQERMPLLLELGGITARDFVSGSTFIPQGPGLARWQSAFQPLFTALPTLSPGDGAWVMAMATEEVSNTLTTGPARRFVKSMTLARPLDQRSQPPSPDKPEAMAEVRGEAGRAQARSRRPTPARPPAVVMGVIDDGIGFAHERFRTTRHGTRVASWWLMDGPANNPRGGYMLDKPAIDALLAACSDATGVLDEDLFYRRAELLDFRQPGHKSAAMRASHGTHIMDLACGFDPAENRTDRPIVCVQLPTRVTEAVDNGSLLPYVAQAIDHIVGTAITLAAELHVAGLPIVINFSYGRLEGPHDGTHPVERLIEQVIQGCEAIGFPLRVVLPAGNSLLSRTHAQRSFRAAARTETLHWRVLPDDLTESFVEIWLPPPAAGAPASRLRVTLTAPTGQSASIDETMTAVPFPLGELSYVALPTARTFVLILHPTSDLAGGGTVAPAGTYAIRLEHTGGLSSGDRVHAWVARDESLPGYPHAGRQSILEDSHYERLDEAGREKETDTAASAVRRRGTINSIATGKSTIVLGAFLRREKRLARYSAAGVGPSPSRRRPDASAASDDSLVHAGVLAAGTRSNSVAAIDGTSVAAPQIARRVADLLAAGRPGGATEVRALATMPLDHPERSGAGGIVTTPVVRLPRYEGP